jgi:hypothetical protein
MIHTFMTPSQRKVTGQLPRFSGRSQYKGRLLDMRPI